MLNTWKNNFPLFCIKSWYVWSKVSKTNLVKKKKCPFSPFKSITQKLLYHHGHINVNEPQEGEKLNYLLKYCIACKSWQYWSVGLEKWILIYIYAFFIELIGFAKKNKNRPVVDCKIPAFVQRWVYNRPNFLPTVEK